MKRKIIIILSIALLIGGYGVYDYSRSVRVPKECIQTSKKIDEIITLLQYADTTNTEIFELVVWLKEAKAGMVDWIAFLKNQAVENEIEQWRKECIRRLENLEGMESNLQRFPLPKIKN